MRPGCRRDGLEIRIASPPIAVGRTWPAVYETKYARTSQPRRSSIPARAQQQLPAQAIGTIVTIMIAAAQREPPGGRRRG